MIPEDNFFSTLQQNLEEILRILHHHLNKDTGMNGNLDQYREYIQQNTIGKDDVMHGEDKYHISTMHLPILSEDHYETCVFFKESSEVVEVYSTREAAEESHANWLRKIAEEGMPDEEDEDDGYEDDADEEEADEEEEE
jgi:hypothetical protein